MPDCGETLVMNPGFDTTKMSWSPETGIVLTWDTAGDQNGNTASGGLLVKNGNVSNGNGWILQGAYQCVPVTAGSTYQLTTQLSIAPDQGDVSAVVGLLTYASGDCSGAPNGAAISDQVTTTATCEALTLSRAVPSGAVSVAVRLGVLKPFPQAPVQVEFDNVLFKKL